MIGLKFVIRYVIYERAVIKSFLMLDRAELCSVVGELLAVLHAYTQIFAKDLAIYMRTLL